MPVIIKDPIWGFYEIEDWALPIIDHPAFQRLRRIRQLAGAEVVYPAANHTRFEHSLGVAHLALKISNVVDKRLRERGEDGLTEEDKRTVYLAGLLHDVGHFAFSHAAEGLLDLYGKNHEDFTRRIILELLSSEIEKAGCDPEIVAECAAGKEIRKVRDRPFLKEIVGSAIDADKLDWLPRDSYHTGVPYGLIDSERIILFMNVENNHIVIHEKAKQALEMMLLGRALCFQAIYFHKTSRAAQILIDQALKAANDELNLGQAIDDLNEYVKYDDYVMWTKLLHANKSREYIERLANRRLYKVAYEFSALVKVGLPAADLLGIMKSRKTRETLRQMIAEEANVDSRFVIIDAPTLPTIPYSFLSEDPMRISILMKNGEIKSLTEISDIAETLRAFLYIIRIYTLEEYRERVRKAALDVLSGGVSKAEATEQHV